MNHIKPAMWSPEWFEFITTDELVTVLERARVSLARAVKARHSTRTELWKGRIHRIEEELGTRKDAMEEWEEAY